MMLYQLPVEIVGEAINSVSI